MKDKSISRIQHRQKTERVSGDLLNYFVLHNVYSSLLFFLITFCVGIYAQQLEVYDLGGWELVSYIISSKFLEMAIQTTFILFLCCVIGRIGAYYSIKAYLEYRDRKQQVIRATKRWSEYNQKINRMGFKWFISTIFTAIIYCLGAITILSIMLFNEKTLLPLLMVYVFVKIGVHFFTKWLIGKM